MGISPRTIVGAALVGALILPVSAAGQAPQVTTTQPESDGTPVPRTPEGRVDLSGIWNKPGSKAKPHIYTLFPSGVSM